MERFLLKQDIVDRIKKDQILYGQVASLANVTILSMRILLVNNSAKLTQASVLNHLKNYLGVESESELLDVVPDTDHNDNKPSPIMQASH